MTILPADHYIADEAEFRATILRAQQAAVNGPLITLGIKPDRPETGYGYIEADKKSGGEGPYPVARFVEKPSVEKALEFLASGNFYWNSGMFVWQVRVILREIERHMPELYTGLMKLNYSSDMGESADLTPQIAALYGEIKGESIDYGVMEKAGNVLVIPADFGWSDVGSWRAFPGIIRPDEAGNWIIDADDSVTIDSRGCLVYGGGKLVALVGVKNLIIVNTGDALMVCAEERAQEVKKVVEELEQRGMNDYL
jgi:mannose-1-phosphate guanylyltransferase